MFVAATPSECLAVAHLCANAASGVGGGTKPSSAKVWMGVGSRGCTQGTDTHTHSKAEVVNIALHNMHRGFGGHVLLATCSKASSILAGCSRRRHRKCRQPVRQASNMPGHL
jgi:hypothetical protein